jgi:hypothetical protein
MRFSPLRRRKELDDLKARIVKKAALTSAYPYRQWKERN